MSQDLDETVARLNAYAEAGADVIFIESPETEAEMAEIGKHIRKPLFANMVEGGRTPILPQEKLYALLFKRHSGSKQLAQEAGFSQQYVRAVLAGKSKEGARRQLAACLTAEEIMVLGWEFGTA